MFGGSIRYFDTVNGRFFRWRDVAPAAVIVLAAVLFPLTAFAKPIRLRNGEILSVSRAAAEHSPKTLSGLFLVQFRDAIQPDWRAQVSERGVDLLYYVPEDAFLARCHHVDYEALANLPFVARILPYRPEHKMHAAVARGGKQVSDDEMPVAILLAPRAPHDEISTARMAMSAVRQDSKTHHGRILRGRVKASRMEMLAQSEVVLWIEPDRGMKLFDEISSALVAGSAEPGVLYTQSLGYDGSGVTVAVADSGLHNGDAETMHPDLEGRTPAFFAYGGLPDAADEHSHGTHVAGIVAGDGATGEADETSALYGLGVAPGASIVAQRIFDGAGNYYAPPSYERLTRDATRAGAEIGSNSWGDDTQGRYDLSAMEFDGLVRDADSLLAGNQQYIMEFSAGNAGPGTQTIGSPAVGKNVIATGAAQNDRLEFIIYGDGADAMADFSSRGPCEDGRIKPDLVAPGTWIASLQSASATDQYAWGSISASYQYQGGTSQAGPHVSGAAAVFVQYYRETQTNTTPSPALVKAALINSAFDLDDSFGTGPIPNNDEGWGAVDLVEFVAGFRQYEFLDQAVRLSLGQVYEQRVLIDNPDEALKVTLVYTDVPGFPGAIPALVNNLDLEVLGPDGKLYLGNQFLGGESMPDTGRPDPINNVEGVHLPQPVPGQYIIRVRAQNVAQDACVETPVVDQDFALVVSGSMAVPGTGIVTFDRPAYRAPDVMRITLVDDDLAGQPTATIRLNSSTETIPEIVVLQASGLNLFTGVVATALGSVTADGVLQVMHNDFIDARYQDASPSANRLYSAIVDLFPPVITGVTVNNRFSQAEAQWTTDELASSLVLYGATPELGLSLTNNRYLQAHTVRFSGLTPGSTNWFKIVCIDHAGNISTNDNGGALYQFVSPRAPAVLIVDGFYGDVWLDPPPPIDIYTSLLNQLGVDYDVWEIATEPNEITAEALAPYRVVLWRVAELMSRSPFTVNETTAIQTYLTGGGSLFLASMEATSRMRDYGAGTFLQDVLHIADFVEDPGVFEVVGVADDPVGRDVELSLDSLEFLGEFIYGYVGELTDTITPGAGAVGFLSDVDSGGYVGIRYPRVGSDDPGRVVYLAFALDIVTDPQARQMLMRRVLSFLAPGLNGEGTLAFDRSAYTIPSQLTVELADSSLEGLPEAPVIFYSEAIPAGLPVMLQPSVRPGVFIGKVSLVETNTAGVNLELKVRDGEMIRAEYFDSSLNGVVTAHAAIETQPPVITFVAADPGYVDAIISWETSEPADATVQFGESFLLGRSAGTEQHGTFHEITLNQLQPDRTYYYRVISRDRAGNVRVDDDGGKLHSFRTLAPLVPPWLDNMEHGGSDWAVYSPIESEGAWELGVPNPLLGLARSPANCWGTNLRLQSDSMLESYLISPAIQLTGGNRATLRFAQSYDFSMQFEFDIFHAGEVLLIPSDAATPIALATFSDEQMGWHEIELDLSPYMGKVVYIAWHYFLFAFDPWPRPGWMIDDVSISTSDVQSGMVVISNNLWQAKYALSGPVGGNGTGRYQVYSNAPPGQYTLEFAEVPYYQTPAPQQKSVTSGETTVFAGVYSFVDVNGNGISDIWEQQFFANTSSLRTADTDTDGDGLTDLEEFLAGTDPNSPPRPFALSVGSETGNLRLEWPSVPSQFYRVHTSTNLVGWLPGSSWIEATSVVTQVEIPVWQGKDSAQFRVQVGATNSPAGLWPELKLATYDAGSMLQLVWPAVPGRAYRIGASTNTIYWDYASDWLPATAPVMTNSVTRPGDGATWFYRVEVQP